MTFSGMEPWLFCVPPWHTGVRSRQLSSSARGLDLDRVRGTPECVAVWQPSARESLDGVPERAAGELGGEREAVAGLDGHRGHTGTRPSQC